MSSNDTASRKLLRTLASLHGVQTSFMDITQKKIFAPPETLMAILSAMGVPVAGRGDIENALCERRREMRKRVLEPVCVAWERGRAFLNISLPAAQLTNSAMLRIHLEDGPVAECPLKLGDFTVVDRERIDGQEYVTVRAPLPAPRAIGYHRLEFECGSTSGECLLIVTPQRCYGADETPNQWGTFLPLYALRSTDDWGIGDFSGLRTLVRWTRELGGDIVGTLPVLATFLEEPCDFSPYSPVSRKFWNEVFLDVTKAPEWSQHEDAGAVAERDTLHQSDLVEYRRVMKLKRSRLSAFSKRADNNAGFKRFLETKPEVERYAVFRAACEKYGVPWWNWPEHARNEELKGTDLNPESVTYHKYVQWLAEEQLAAAACEAPNGEQEIYLDFPVGVHPAGYDTWNDREVFMRDLSVGAPPDDFFVKGQKWGLPPLHPETLRRTGYRYLRESLAHNMKYARVLRVDHIMAFHRIFCVPENADATAGTYIRYPAKELYAVLAIESHRHHTTIVGEDLGTVPQEVRTSMKQHGVKRMYVLQFSFQDDADEPIAPPPSRSLASLNTHDTPTFASFITGDDIDRRLELELLADEEAGPEQERRMALRERLRTVLAEQQLLTPSDEGVPALLRGLLKHLSKGEADMVLVNLEDLWLERLPQNVPGTTTELPNWRRKARFSFEEFSTDESILGILREVNECRKASRK